MSDHLSGPRATADPALDISDVYAFPSPDRPDRFVLAMMVFPFATPQTRFSDAVDYRFRLRPAQIAPTGERPAFVIGEAERIISVTFDASPPDGGDGPAQTGACVLPSGTAVAVPVGEDAGGEANGVRVFAGCRLDPFFIDQGVTGALRQTRRLPERLSHRNSLAGHNVLAIVVEGERATLFGDGDPSLFATVAETTTLGSPRLRLERLGRPEIKNFILLDRASDPVNRDIDLRDLYDMEDPFALRPDYLSAYRACLNGSLAAFDRLDDTINWPLDADGNHPLTELLLADFLMVDVTKPYDDDGYLEIERALLRGEPHATCGGRTLNHDMVDTFLTFLINGGQGPRIADGVDQATIPASPAFPYLQPANPHPPARPTFAAPTPAG